MGIGLLVLFAVNLVIRQFVEPKIVGKNLGIHPVVSLILLYVGYHFFGFFGLLLIPFMTVILNTVFKREEDVSQ
jgi:predicted PurR-regulated permease PerM